eukprot:2085629-Pyramimonas_sp.AAC.1
MHHGSCVLALLQHRRETTGVPESLAPRHHRCATADVDGPCKGGTEEGGSSNARIKHWLPISPWHE